MRVLDAGGRVVAAHPAGAGSLPAGLAERLVAEAQGGEAAIETDWTRGEGRYVLAAAAPMEGGGACVARIDGEALKDLFGGIALPERTVVITLLDSRRRVIYRSQTPESTLGLDLSDIEETAGSFEKQVGIALAKSGQKIDVPEAVVPEPVKDEPLPPAEDLVKGVEEFLKQRRTD